MNDNAIITEISTLGEAKIPSPILQKENRKAGISLVSNDHRILVDVNAVQLTELVRDGQEPLCFELAGPREKIFFDPSKLRCALVTCGGLCPGLNDIIRSIVFATSLWLRCFAILTAFATAWRGSSPNTGMILLI